MYRKIFFSLFSIFLLNSVFSQKLELPTLYITDASISIKISDVPDSIKEITISFLSEDYKTSFLLKPNNGVIDTNISLASSGNYSVVAEGIQLINKSIRILPGILSVIPPLLAILLALILRQVIVSLAAGIYAGAFFIYDYNPFQALLRVADWFILNALIDKDHMYIILFTLLIGGVVGVISKNGGTAGLAKQITRLAKTPRSGMISSWLLGILIFFDDYANSLIIGNMMRPITDKLKISREKLSYIVDSTAAPIASIVIISTWVGYEVGLIDDGLSAIGFTGNAYDVFLQSIPYSFYPIAAIVFVFLTSFMNRDFGSMYKAENRARTTGKVTEEGEIRGLSDERNLLYKGSKARWYNGAVPILIILFGTIGGLVYTGISNLSAAGSLTFSVREIISASDSYSSLLWASFLASIAAIVMSVSQRILKIEDAISAWHKGIESMLIAVIILVFAWSISAVTNDLKTADFIISLLSDSINPSFLPLIIFLICAVIGFSTGTSWGTMAIVMPIVIPLTNKVGLLSGIPEADLTLIMYAVISAVLAGSVFGDHCSPIADTTILSSLASRCNHMDHVRTQLPYAIIVGIISIIFGYIPSGFGVSPLISLVLIVASMIGFLLLFGKKVDAQNAG
ncbi:MAG: Na+/H+ antiporter NhaC family protein [Bacteroidetes bacterium]|nr:Na+/H+ antiporter NhaC family protein [Bacteroidota bacterium]